MNTDNLPKRTSGNRSCHISFHQLIYSPTSSSISMSFFRGKLVEVRLELCYFSIIPLTCPQASNAQTLITNSLKIAALEEP